MGFIDWLKIRGDKYSSFVLNVFSCWANNSGKFVKNILTLPFDGTVISAIDRRAYSTIVSFSDFKSVFNVSNPLLLSAASAPNLKKNKIIKFIF